MKAAAIGLGIYSIAGLRYYSILASRMKSEWMRLAVAIPSMALFIFTPMVGCMFLLGARPVPSSREMRAVWMLAVFLSWTGTIWVYIIRNYRVLKARLGFGELSSKP